MDEFTKPKIQFEIKFMLITPSIAEKMLEYNINNRHLNSIRVDGFVRLLKQGLFQTTHQGIAFDPDGKLIDGQHRLAAIVKSGCSVYMLVSRGLPVSAKLVVDTGEKRDSRSISKIIGRNDTQKHFAIAKMLKYGPIKSTQMNVPNELLFELVDTFSEGIDFTLSLPGCKNLQAAITTVVARASYTKDHETLRRFVEILKTGENRNVSEIAPMRLKLSIASRFSRSAPNGGGEYRNSRQYIYNITESALVDFINKYPTKVLREVTIEQFPLPAHLNGWNGK
jgi:hypothetical protein